MRKKETVRILFVRRGNICRSPMAEFIMKSLAEKAGRIGDFERTWRDVTEGCAGLPSYLTA